MATWRNLGMLAVKTTASIGLELGWVGLLLGAVGVLVIVVEEGCRE